MGPLAGKTVGGAQPRGDRGPRLATRASCSGWSKGPRSGAVTLLLAPQVQAERPFELPPGLEPAQPRHGFGRGVAYAVDPPGGCAAQDGDGCLWCLEPARGKSF